jgi:hypothetical protein
VGYDGVTPDGVELTVNGKQPKPEKYTPKPEGLRPIGAETGGCAYVPEGSETVRYPVDTQADGGYRLTFSGAHGKVTYIEVEI